MIGLGIAILLAAAACGAVGLCGAAVFVAADALERRVLAAPETPEPAEQRPRVVPLARPERREGAAPAAGSAVTAPVGARPAVG